MFVYSLHGRRPDRQSKRTFEHVEQNYALKNIARTILNSQNLTIMTAHFMKTG